LALSQTALPVDDLPSLSPVVLVISGIVTPEPQQHHNIHMAVRLW